jgi:hypothetical protein
LQQYFKRTTAANDYDPILLDAVQSTTGGGITNRIGHDALRNRILEVCAPVRSADYHTVEDGLRTCGLLTE